MDSFFARPILNSPYAYPGRHWELDDDGQPTNRIVDSQRRSELITPVPSRRSGGAQRVRQRQALHAVPASRFIAAPMRRQTILNDVPRRLNGGLQAVMDKRGLSERDICTKFITPAQRKVGWDCCNSVRTSVSLRVG